MFMRPTTRDAQKRVHWMTERELLDYLHQHPDQWPMAFWEGMKEPRRVMGYPGKRYTDPMTLIMDQWKISNRVDMGTDIKGNPIHPKERLKRRLAFYRSMSAGLEEKFPCSDSKGLVWRQRLLQELEDEAKREYAYDMRRMMDEQTDKID